jgi:quercetin 2,3-dioxygenase
MQIRRSNERGHADHGWLDSYHSFSFANYYDPKWVQFGGLRVINEDRIAPGSGLGTHGHRDMEIVSYVLEGELAHKDSMGNVEVIRPGEVQRMSAGRGVQHSEFNHAQGKQTHFLQIWIAPKFTGIEPGYEQKAFADSEKRGQLRLVVSPDGAQGSVTANADARLYAGLLDGAETAQLELAPGRKTYVHVVRGQVAVNDAQLQAGDAALWQVTEDSRLVSLSNGRDAEVLVFDLAA